MSLAEQLRKSFSMESVEEVQPQELHFESDDNEMDVDITLVNSVVENVTIKSEQIKSQVEEVESLESIHQYLLEAIADGNPSKREIKFVNDTISAKLSKYNVPTSSLSASLESFDTRPAHSTKVSLEASRGVLNAIADNIVFGLQELGIGIITLVTHSSNLGNKLVSQVRELREKINPNHAPDNDIRVGLSLSATLTDSFSNNVLGEGQFAKKLSDTFDTFNAVASAYNDTDAVVEYLTNTIKIMKGESGKGSIKELVTFYTKTSRVCDRKATKGQLLVEDSRFYDIKESKRLMGHNFFHSQTISEKVINDLYKAFDTVKTKPVTDAIKYLRDVTGGEKALRVLVFLIICLMVALATQNSNNNNAAYATADAYDAIMKKFFHDIKNTSRLKLPTAAELMYATNNVFLENDRDVRAGKTNKMVSDVLSALSGKECLQVLDILEQQALGMVKYSSLLPKKKKILATMKEVDKTTANTTGIVGKRAKSLMSTWVTNKLKLEAAVMREQITIINATMKYIKLSQKTN